MAKTRLPYAPEFRRRMVAPANAGRTPEDLAAEFEPTAQSIRNWVSQHGMNAWRTVGAVRGLVCSPVCCVQYAVSITNPACIPIACHDCTQ
jgi:transposase